MPRPSLKDVRRVEILDAFAACVARFGLEGATLDKVAAEAGLARPLIRHYLGNRQEMVGALIDHVMQRFDGNAQALVADLPDAGRLEALMDRLFHEGPRSAENAALFQVLVGAADRHPGIHQAILDFVVQFETSLDAELAVALPSCGAERRRTVAAGIASIYFNVAAVGPLEPEKSWLATQRAAADLLLSLAVRD